MTSTDRGGTHGEMHAALDNLDPHQAVAAVAEHFPGWHVHEDPETGTVWAETDQAPGIGPPIPLREPDAEHMWQAIAAAKHRWDVAHKRLHGHPAVA